MKRKIAIAVVALSVIGNVLGIICFVNYLKALGHLKLATQEVSILMNTLSFAQTARVVGDLASPEKVERRAFISHYDSEEDLFAVEPVALPTKTRDVTLFVCLHGMGHNCMEPFVMPKDSPLSDAILAKDHSYVVLSPNYRAPAAWASDGAMSDITQSIRILCAQYPVKRIILIGSSMGGCVSLSYSALAPADIRKMIQGVVCIEGAGDLAELYHLTHLPTVRITLEQCFGGPPENVAVAYAAKSLMPNISSVSPQTRLAIISARQDKTVPPVLQDTVFNAFRANGHQATLIPVEMEHGWPSLSIVLQAVDFVLKGEPAPKKGH